MGLTLHRTLHATALAIQQLSFDNSARMVVEWRQEVRSEISLLGR